VQFKDSRDVDNLAKQSAEKHQRAIAEGLGQFAELNHAAGVSAGRFEVKALLGCS